MEIRHLQALLGIADSGSFSGAAQGLGTVQSNVSAQIARLEGELQVNLVDRGTGRLSEEGEVVAERARRVMAELDGMIADVAALRDQVVGAVQVGIIGTTSRWLVPDLFARARARHPHVRLQVVDGTNSTLVPQVISGRLDLAVVTMPAPEDELATTALFEEDLVLVVPAEHELAQPRSSDARRVPLPLSCLDRLDLLLPVKGTALREEIDRACDTAGTRLRPSLELDGMRLIASLTFDGYGPSIMPASSVPPSMRGRFALVPLESLPRRTVGMALRRRGLPPAPVRAVMDLLRQSTETDEQLPDGLHPAPRVAA